MSDLERLHRIKYMIQARKCVPIQDFLDELEISKATFKRDLEYLRDRMNASIMFDRAEGGYRFDTPNAGEKIEGWNWNFFIGKTKYPAKGTYIYKLTLQSESSLEVDTISGKLVIQ